ncbi:Chondroitin polymerase [uncultured Clostridium sp.]|nr:Chondroitin polymerase [uncultured Clostridium sp.]SCJ15739.1 Chondroitin polymerase [uncultured Clostridium sp.]
MKKKIRKVIYVINKRVNIKRYIKWTRRFFIGNSINIISKFRFRKIDEYYDGKLIINELLKYRQVKINDGRVAWKNKSSIDLSIIIPAYNVSMFIEECIDSILNQETNYSYEVIVIDDGSKDDTLKKIEKYEDNSEVNIICQKNKGVSAARNRGINEARGKYIMFVDSDDVLIDKSIETLMEYAYKYNADIVEGGYTQGKLNKELIKVKQKKEIIKIESYKTNPNFILSDTCSGFPWGKIYKRHLWDKVRFPEGVVFEDTIIKYIILRMSKKYVYTNKKIYGYRSNENSIMYNYRKNYKGLDSIFVVIHIMETLKKINLSNDEALYKLTLYQLGPCLYDRVRDLDKCTQEKVLTVCKDILINMKNERPNDMNIWERQIEASILSIDVELWRVYSKIICI